MKKSLLGELAERFVTQKENLAKTLPHLLIYYIYHYLFYQYALDII